MQLSIGTNTVPLEMVLLDTTCIKTTIIDCNNQNKSIKLFIIHKVQISQHGIKTSLRILNHSNKLVAIPETTQQPQIDNN
jgi:hypothetical protein